MIEKINKKITWLLIHIGKPLYDKKLYLIPGFKKIYKIFIFIYKKVGTSMLVVINRNKIKYNLLIKSSDGTIEKEILFTGIFDLELYDLFCDKININDIIIDVGANIGYFSILYSKLVGENGKVYAFEPAINTFNKLIKNIKLNSITNIITNQIGIGNKNETLFIFYDKNNIGSSSYVSKEKNSIKEKTIIKKFDSEYKFIKKINFIKIDVEGFELEVLNGMKETIKKFKPNMVVEYSPRFYKKNNRDSVKHSLKIFKYFEKIEYKVFLVLKNKNTYKLEEIIDTQKFIEKTNKDTDVGLYNLYLENKQ